MSVLDRLWSSSATKWLRTVGLAFTSLSVVVVGLSLLMAGAVVVRFVMGMEGLLGLVTAFTILLTALGLAAMAALFRAAERVMELLEEAVGPDGAEM